MLYLASQSPRRRALMKRLGRPFKIIASTHRETIRRRYTPSQNAMRNAKGKALKAVLPLGADGVVIGADTFLYFRGRVIGKPRTWDQARHLLAELSGRSHQVYTGLCVRHLRSRRTCTGFAKSRVTFRRLSPRRIAKYVARIHALDKAGGYAVQEDRGELIARIQGSRTNVIGLPLELLRKQLTLIKRESTDG